MKIVLVVFVMVILTGCVVARKRNIEFSFNAMYMIGRMEQMADLDSGCGFQRVRLKFNFPYWDTEFLECKESGAKK